MESNVLEFCHNYEGFALSGKPLSIFLFMAQICSACGRGTLSANTRSKSMVATKTRKAVNIQGRRIDGVRVKICTNCLKTLAKNPLKVTIKSEPVRQVKRRSKRVAM